MTRIVNVHEAKTHLSKLLEQAHAGEEIILDKNALVAESLPFPAGGGLGPWWRRRRLRSGRFVPGS